MISTAALLDGWERGLGLPVVDQAPSVLSLVDPNCAIDELSVGQCDALLFALYRRLFGDAVDSVTDCPRCGEQVALPLPVDQLQPVLVDDIEPFELEILGYRIRARVPSNNDLRFLAALSHEVGLYDILGRCLLEVTGPTMDRLQVDDLPEDVVAAAVELMSQIDPGAEVTISIICVCGAQWIDYLDIRSVFWARLTVWANEQLNDVERLARAYGWSERTILDISPWRRAWYLQAVE